MKTKYKFVKISIITRTKKKLVQNNCLQLESSFVLIGFISPIYLA